MKKLYIVINILCLIIIAFTSCKKETSCEGCADIKHNKPPIAVAGPDQLITLPTDSILLDNRTTSDQDGSISSYLWTKISGPSFFTILHEADLIKKVKNLAKEFICLN